MEVRLFYKLNDNTRDHALAAGCRLTRLTVSRRVTKPH